MPEYQIYHQLSTIGAYLTALGFFVCAFCLLHSLVRGDRPPANPWGGNTLEWQSPSPPPHDNFAETPVADDPYDYRRWKRDPATGGYVREAGA